jgi:hypothetical protein
MSAYAGAVRIQDKHGAELRLQIHPAHGMGGLSAVRGESYRFARHNGWHCGHWHPTVPAALGCLHEKQP